MRITALRDISADLESERERASLEVRLKRATGGEAIDAQLGQTGRLETVGQLAGGIAHDFNNILGVIINYSQFVIDELDEGSPVRADVEEIWRAARRGAALDPTRARKATPSTSTSTPRSTRPGPAATSQLLDTAARSRASTSASAGFPSAKSKALIREAPRIETERLVLRPWRKDDFASPITRSCSTRRSSATSAPSRWAREECWRRLMPRRSACWQLHRLRRLGGRAQERRQAGRHASACSPPGATSSPNSATSPKWAGSSPPRRTARGLPREACRAALDWAEANLEPTPIWAIIAPGQRAVDQARRTARLRAGPRDASTTASRRWCCAAPAWA